MLDAMRTALRIALALALVVFVATQYVTSFVGATMSLPWRGETGPKWVILLVSLGCGFYAARFTFRRLGQAQGGAPLNFQSGILVGALLGGALAFAVGFFGPMIFTPHSNIGPLLGFFTGPAGALIGAIAGGLYNSLVVRKGRA